MSLCLLFGVLSATMVDVDLEVAERVEWRLWSVVPVYVKVIYSLLYLVLKLH